VENYDVFVAWIATILLSNTSIIKISSHNKSKWVDIKVATI
jgi:hypothetical protein